MSKRSKLVYLLVALLFIFTSLAGGAFAAVQTAALDLGASDTAIFMDGSLDAPAYSIAGDCDMGGGCIGGSG